MDVCKLIEGMEKEPEDLTAIWLAAYPGDTTFVEAVSGDLATEVAAPIRILNRRKAACEYETTQDADRKSLTYAAADAAEVALFQCVGFDSYDLPPAELH